MATPSAVVIAKLAGEAERYDDMMRAMEEFAQTGNLLNFEQRNLLVFSCKEAVDQRRSSWHAVFGLEQDLHDSDGDKTITRVPSENRERAEGHL